MKTKILMMYKDSKTLSSLKAELYEEGYEVTYNSDIEKTIPLIKVNYYDIIVLSLDKDYDLALNMIRDIKTEHLFTNIIAYGHKLNLESILKAYRRGINDYISAPLEPKILKAKIDSLIGMYEILNSKYFSNIEKYGDFVVDKDSNIIYLNNEIINTTKIEYRIIRKLMKANEKCVSKQFLIKSIWGYDDLNSNSLEVFMSSIKKKLNQKYLYSVRNKGYYLSKKEQ
ncbi:MAG: response regulator transcription factor [Mycoplasmoidaceae bacterium]